MRVLSLTYLIIFFLSLDVITAVAQERHVCIGQIYSPLPLDTLHKFDIKIKKDSNIIVQISPDQENNFRFTLSDSGHYTLYIYQPDYLPYSDTFRITKSSTDLGLFKPEVRTTFLDEVIIKDNFISRIKKDTIEFTADSFMTKQFSSVKELLDKIPGIQTLNGNITYNGKPIRDVSLDGIPFLSIDLNRLLSLLRGKDIEKIQLFDNRSQSARMTGINDNIRNVGLNLTLKEEAKKGYYGKAAGGLGVEKSILWDNSINVNSFNDDRRIMVFTETNNTAGSSSIGEMNLPQSSSPSQGKPQTFSTGIHYDSRILKDKKLSYNIDYLINKNTQNIINTSNSTSMVPGNKFITQAIAIAKGNVLMQNLNINLNYAFNTSSFLNATISSNINSGNNKGENSSSSSGLNGTFLNSSNSNINSTISSPNITANITYHKDFRKEGRSANISLVTSLNKNNSDARQVSNSIYATNTQEDNISQQKENNQNNQNHILNFQYTEPFAKNWRLNLNTSSSINKSLSDNKTYDIFKVDNISSDTLNPLYSNNFTSENIQNRVNTVLEYQQKKILLSLGGEISQLRWRQDDISNNISLTRNYFNFLPSVSFRLNMNPNTSLNLEYRSQTTQPQLNEIQPVANNYDPLHIVVGNPGLDQSYTHNMSLNFINSKPFKNRYFNANATFTFVQNAISLKEYYNQDAKQVSQYYNIDGNYNANFYTGYNLKLFRNIQLALNENVFFAKTQNDLNNQKNITFSQQYRSGANVTYAIDTLLSISYMVSFNYSLNNSSLIENSNNKLWNILQNLDISFSLPHGFSIGNRFNWSLRTKTSDSDPNASVFLWNLSISKYLRKNESVMLKLYSYDILNQNKNYQIYYGPNIRSENGSNTIGRYIMLGVIWNFTKR